MDIEVWCEYDSGIMLRFLTSGESHGPGLVVIVEGLPAGIEISVSGVSVELARRRLGFGRGPRMAIEGDRISLVGGVRHGRSLGSPVSIMIENSEFEEKWSVEMSPDPGTPRQILTQPRPGHADLVGMLKYDFDDARNVLERASARETAARVAGGATAKALLAGVGVGVLSHVIEIGGVRVGRSRIPLMEDVANIDANPARCLDADVTSRMEAEIEAARREGDTVGGVFEVVVHGVPAGIGSYVHWDRKLDARIAEAVMSINAIKAVEIGDGLEQSRSRGSVAHDEIFIDPMTGRAIRETNRAGGIEGGMSTGDPIRVRGAMKPLASLGRPLKTIDLETGGAAEAFKQRTDTCAVPAAGVVAESMVAFVVASEMLRKFGGDSLGQFVSSVEMWREHLKARKA